MGEMRNFEAEALAAVERLRHPFHHDDRSHLAEHVAAARATQTPAPVPVNLAVTPVAAATPAGGTMSFITDAEAFIARAKVIGEDVLADVEAIKANPETASILKSAAGLARIADIPAGLIGSVGAGLAGLYDAYTTPAATSPADPAAPAQPVDPALAPAQ